MLSARPFAGPFVLLFLSTASAFAQTAPKPDAGIHSNEATQARARAYLDGFLQDANLDRRADALTGLAYARTPDASQKLLEGLEDKEGKVRFGAARGLGILGDLSTKQAVVDAFKEEKGWFIKKELATTAAALKASELIPELQKATFDENLELAAAAAWALDDLKDPAGQTALTRLGRPARKNVPKEGVDRWSRKVLTGKTPGDRQLAVYTLLRTGTATDLPLFTAQLSSQDPQVRLWAAAGVLRFSAKPTP